VRYVLEGSVQGSANRVRVGVQLIDAASDTYLWVDRFDRDRADLFVLLDEITGRIAWQLLAKARNLSHDGRYSSISRLNPPGYSEVPSLRALYENTLFAGLRKAGMPEE
jgi:hypothetical protein